MQTSGGRSRSVTATKTMRIAIIASRWNDSVTERLVKGARSAIQQAGVAPSSVDLYWVPGAFELPQAAHQAAKTGKYDAIVPLGCLIRGETLHFDFICRSVSVGLDAVGRETGVPVSLGVLTVDHMEQALARSGGQHGNKGEDAALAAMELAAVIHEIRRKKNGQPKSRA